MNIQTLKTTIIRRSLPVLAAAGLAFSVLGSPALAADYENSIDLSFGTALQSGDRPGFQKALDVNKRGYFGIEDLYFTRALSKDTTFTMQAKALLENEDYLIDLRLVKDDVGYVSAGYRQYRIWYDGSGGFFQPKGIPIILYDEDLHLDRSNLWVEIGHTLSEQSGFVLRYDLFTREGRKDSLTMGELTMAASAANVVGARGILPAFRTIDEKRHVLKATITAGNDQASYKVAGTLDKGETNNSLNVRRRYNEPASSSTRNRVPDRVFTQKDNTDFDIFSLNGSVRNQINEKLSLNAAVSRTTIDNVLTGSRIVGNPTGYDPVYDPAFSNRQQRDEGFFDLGGSTESTQTVGMINLMHRPNEFWTFIPAVRFEKVTTRAETEFEETNNAPDTANPTDLLHAEVLAVHTRNDRKSATESLDVRYTGFKSVSVSFKGEWNQTSGDIAETEIAEPGLLNEISIQRIGDYEVLSQKYSMTASWYPVAGTTVAAQYYYRVRQNDYATSVDNTLNAYPGYITNMDTETHDMNVRLSWRATSTLRLVTRYDYQQSTIRMQSVDRAFGRASKQQSHVLSETATWNPLPRWYLQASVNVVWDTLRTPRSTFTGNAEGILSNSDNNYINGSIGSGYALDDQSDVYVDYSIYSANNFTDTNYRSVSYGADAKTQQAALTYTRKLDARTKLTLRYAYAKHDEDSFGGYANYEAHMLYGKIQYRF